MSTTTASTPSAETSMPELMKKMADMMQKGVEVTEESKRKQKDEERKKKMRESIRGMNGFEGYVNTAGPSGGAEIVFKVIVVIDDEDEKDIVIIKAANVKSDMKFDAFQECRSVNIISGENGVRIHFEHYCNTIKANFFTLTIPDGRNIYGRVTGSGETCIANGRRTKKAEPVECK